MTQNSEWFVDFFVRVSEHFWNDSAASFRVGSLEGAVSHAVLQLVCVVSGWWCRGHCGGTDNVSHTLQIWRDFLVQCVSWYRFCHLYGRRARTSSLSVEAFSTTKTRHPCSTQTCRTHILSWPIWTMEVIGIPSTDCRQCNGVMCRPVFFSVVVAVTSWSRTSETGERIFGEIFNDLFRHFPKVLGIIQKNSSIIYHPKFLDDLFLVIDPLLLKMWRSSAGVWNKIHSQIADIDRRGKPLLLG